jgi:hypothetical protein
MAERSIAGGQLIVELDRIPAQRDTYAARYLRSDPGLRYWT